MIELALTTGIIGTGIGFWIADMLATRKWRNETMLRRCNETVSRRFNASRH
jgi:hypothetical protein